MSSFSQSKRKECQQARAIQYNRYAEPHPDKKVSRHIVRKNYKQRANDYNSDDILIVCNKRSSTDPLSRYFTRMKVRTSNPLDEGRNITCYCTTSSDEAADLVVNQGKTYGFILTDMFFDDDMSGRELIRLIRSTGYSNAIIYLVESGIHEEMEKYFMNVGADALLVKGTKTMKAEFIKLVGDLIFRKNEMDDELE